MLTPPIPSPSSPQSDESADASERGKSANTLYSTTKVSVLVSRFMVDYCCCPRPLKQILHGSAYGDPGIIFSSRVLFSVGLLTLASHMNSSAPGMLLQSFVCYGTKK